MFKPLPNSKDGGAWTSSDAVSEEDVIWKISEARRLKEVLAQEMEKSVELEADLGAAHYATRMPRQAAYLARVDAILYASMFVEGALNFWGTRTLGADFYKEHLERGQVNSKLALLLAFNGYGRIQKSHPVFRALIQLFERRNQLVHRKTKELDPSQYSGQKEKRSIEEDLEVCENAMKEFDCVLPEDDQTLRIMMGFQWRNGAL